MRVTFAARGADRTGKGAPARSGCTCAHGSGPQGAPARVPVAPVSAETAAQPSRTHLPGAAGAAQSGDGARGREDVAPAGCRGYPGRGGARFAARQAVGNARLSKRHRPDPPTRAAAPSVTPREAA